MDNPFEAPEVEDEAPPSSDLVPLYSSMNVAGTTFLGSSLAGSVMVIANAWRRQEGVLAVVLACAVFNTVFFASAFVLPDEIPSFVYTIVSIGALRWMNDAFHGTAIAQRELEGVPPAPWWHGLLVGLAGLFVLLGVILLAIGALVVLEV
ncbi:MAG: hypothetical protein R3F61_03015 [Myxococcota bacterium]